jgi:microcystin-dependent protein
MPDFDPLPPINPGLRQLCPPGTVAVFAGYVAPNKPEGWVPCDGEFYFKEMLPHLFAVIGYRFGQNGDSFRVPDLRGRVVLAAGSGEGLSPRNLGERVGAEGHILSVREMPVHDHRAAGAWHPLGAEGRAPKPFQYHGNAPLQGGGGLGSGWEYDGTLTSDAGGGAAHNNMQPSLVLHYMIKY